MSSEDLPVHLTKLEIAPSLPQIKLIDKNVPLTFNPFYDIKLKDEDSNYTHQLQDNPIRSRGCRRCRLRRSSESVLDDYKSATSSSTEFTTPRIQRSTLKKSSTSAGYNRRIIIKEPILKALQTCLHPQSNTRRKLMNSVVDGDNLEKNVCEESQRNIVITSNNRGMCDFGDLINECQNLLCQEVRSNHWNSKKFTTIQKFKCHKPIEQCDKKNLIAMKQEALGHDNTISPIAQYSITSYPASALPSTEQNAIITRPFSSITLNSTANTSCSQQAGNGLPSTCCDDVTIDELASYFDTLVHIPKKMSSMAEMMYI